MIDPAAVREYLSRKFKSYVWLKDVPQAEIDRHLASLRPVPKFRAPLRLHQKACFLVGLAEQDWFFLNDMGTGKTALMLELLSYLHRIGEISRAIVIVPMDTVAYGWEEEVANWKMPIGCHLLLGSTKDKWSLFEEGTDGIYVATYKGLATMISDREQVRGARTKKGRRKIKLRPSRKLLKRLCAKLDALVLDESTFAANRESLFYRSCNFIAGHVRYRYCLAGRPFGRDPTQLWAQFYIVDRGKTLGPSLGFYRSIFFTEHENPWSRWAKVYKFDKSKEPLLSRIMENKSIRYSADECVDLPQKTSILKRVRLPEDTEHYYQRIVDEIIAAKGKVSMMANPFLRMRQLSSGFLGYKDDLTDERAQVEFEENPKLDLLCELLGELPAGAKALVFHEFTYSGRLICQRLKELGIKHGWIWSGTKDYRSIKRQFDDPKGLQVLVINHKKGAYGLNLQSARYLMVYESPVSAIDRDQMIRRVIREGQKAKRVFIIDLVMRDTVDEAILRYHAQGDNLFRALVRDPIAVLEGHKPSKIRHK